jgi:hypothetical protein
MVFHESFLGIIPATISYEKQGELRAVLDLVLKLFVPEHRSSSAELEK